MAIEDLGLGRNIWFWPVTITKEVPGTTSYTSGVGQFVIFPEFRTIQSKDVEVHWESNLQLDLDLEAKWTVVSGNTVQIRFYTQNQTSGAAWTEVADGTSLSGVKIVVEAHGFFNQ